MKPDETIQTMDLSTLGEQNQPLPEIIDVAPEPSKLDAMRQKALELTAETPPAKEEAAPKKVIVPKDVAAVTPPAYSPSFKYKVMKQEKEFDEFLRPSIKDAETEKKVRELYEKAEGLEHKKAHADRLQETLGQMEPAFTELKNNVAQVEQALQNRDYDTVMERLGVGDEDLYRYVLDKINREKNPELARQYKEGRQSRQREAESTAQVSSMENELGELRHERAQFQYEREMAREDVARVAKAYGERLGKPEAFSDRVRQIGLAFYAQNSRDLSVAEVVEIAFQELSPIFPVQQALPQETQQVSTPEESQRGARILTRQESKTTIPNLNSNGASPVRKQTRSLADLRKLAEELAGQGR